MITAGRSLTDGASPGATGCYTAVMDRLTIFRCCRAVGAAALLVLGAPGAVAVTVHTWIDEAGVRHYADAPPGDNGATEAFEIADTGPVADAATDYYSVTNQWARVRAEREAAAARRAEVAAARAAREPAWAPPIVVEQRGGWPLPYGGFYGLPYPGPEHAPRRRDRGAADRAAYRVEPGRPTFVPTPTPAWPRERGWHPR